MCLPRKEGEFFQNSLGKEKNDSFCHSLTECEIHNETLFRGPGSQRSVAIKMASQPNTNLPGKDYSNESKSFCNSSEYFKRKKYSCGMKSVEVKYFQGTRQF